MPYDVVHADGLRLPSEASPAEVAKDGQHDNDDDDDPKPARHVILSFRSRPTLRRSDPFLQPARPMRRAARIALGEVSPSRM